MASKKLEPPAVKKNETVFLQWLTRAKDSVDLPGEGELVESIEKKYVEYLTEDQQPSSATAGWIRKRPSGPIMRWCRHSSS